VEVLPDETNKDLAFDVVATMFLVVEMVLLAVLGWRDDELRDFNKIALFCCSRLSLHEKAEGILQLNFGMPYSCRSESLKEDKMDRALDNHFE